MKISKFLKRIFGLENVLYERLQIIMWYFQNIDVDERKIHILNKAFHILDPWVEFEFETGYGAVRIKLSRVYDGEHRYTFDYVDYTGCYAFEIQTSRTKTKIKPMLIGDIKAKDIDLSIYELELYLKYQYGEIRDILDSKERDKKLHKQEVDKLIKGQIS